MLSVGKTEDRCWLQECVPVHFLKDVGVFVDPWVRISVLEGCVLRRKYK